MLQSAMFHTSNTQHSQTKTPQHKKTYKYVPVQRHKDIVTKCMDLYPIPFSRSNFRLPPMALLVSVVLYPPVHIHMHIQGGNCICLTFQLVFSTLKKWNFSMAFISETQSTECYTLELVPNSNMLCKEV